MNNNTILHAIAISLVSNNGKFSYSQTGEMYSKVSLYQLKCIETHNLIIPLLGGGRSCV